MEYRIVDVRCEKGRGWLLNLEIDGDVVLQEKSSWEIEKWLVDHSTSNDLGVILEVNDTGTVSASYDFHELHQTYQDGLDFDAGLR